MKLTFTAPISDAQAEDIKTKFKASGGVSSGSSLIPGAQKAKDNATVTPMAGGPNGAQIKCDGSYWWEDQDGKYSVQRMCNNQYAPWGYRMSAYAQSLVAGSGYVQELGLGWTRNGVRQGNQAPHTEYKNYYFHGRYSGITPNASVVYQDYIHYPCNLGSGCQATLSFWGSHWFSAVKF